jgi:hypothetical protein
MSRVVKKYKEGGKEPQLTSVPEGQQHVKTLLDYLAGKYHSDWARSQEGAYEVFVNPRTINYYVPPPPNSYWTGHSIHTRRKQTPQDSDSFPNIPEKEINLGTDESGKTHTLRQGFSPKQPLQLERIDPLPLREIESSDTGDIDIRDIIRSESISLPKEKKPRLIMKKSRKTRTGEEPNYYVYWDKDKKKWKRRRVEKEEYDRYMRENRIRKPQIIKASF